MKRLLLGFFVGAFIAPLFQREPPRPDTITVTARDCIDTITDYTILHHQPSLFIPNNTYGLTDFSDRTVHIFDNFPLDTRRRTAIHELIHIKLATLGEDQWAEDAINTAELRLYKEIFLPIP